MGALDILQIYITLKWKNLKISTNQEEIENYSASSPTPTQTNAKNLDRTEPPSCEFVIPHTFHGYTIRYWW